MSFGGWSDFAPLHQAIIAVKKAGIVQIAAAGNEYGGQVIVPGAYPEVIAVSSTNDKNKISFFSSIGKEVDLAAPGENIYSSFVDETGQPAFIYLSGTSMACPHVVGSVALLLATPRYKNATPDEIKARLERTAKDLGKVGWDIKYGHGLVKADLAVPGQ